MNRFFRHLKNHFVPHEGNEYKPHLLRHESMLFMFLLIILIELSFLAHIFIVFDKTKFLASVLPGVLTSLTNDQREDNNLPKLQINPLLTEAAKLKANDMATRGYFSHNTPEGFTPWYWLDRVGYNYKYAGENLAVNFFESESVAQAWMNSPSHRANIVKKDYTEIGIAVASGIYEGRDTVFAVQFFGTPKPKVAETKVISTTPAQKIIPTKPGAQTVKKVATKTKVLGEETPIKVTQENPAENKIESTLLDTENLTTVKKEFIPVSAEIKEISEIKLFFEKILTSPKNSVAYVYGFIVFILALCLGIVIFIRSEIRHPIVMLRGLTMISVIILLLFFNIKVVSTSTKLPLESSEWSFIAN
ncbi:MAG: CAP domain-containing protein [Patescibacteria group bacterium]